MYYYRRVVQQQTGEIDEEEEDVFQMSEQTEIKTYSTEKATRFLYGQGFSADHFIHNLTEEEKEAIERARYCRKLLLQLKARQASSDAGEADIKKIIQQEELQEWLENLELRLSQNQFRETTSSMVEDIPGWLVAPFGFKVSTTMNGEEILDMSGANVNAAVKAASAAVRWKGSSTGKEKGHADDMATVLSKLPSITSLGGSIDDPMAAEMEAALADLVARLCSNADDSQGHTPRSELSFKASPRVTDVKSVTPTGSPRALTPTQSGTPTKSRAVRFKEKAAHSPSTASTSSTASSKTRPVSKTTVPSVASSASVRSPRLPTKASILSKMATNSVNTSVDSASTLTVPEERSSARRSGSIKGRDASLKNIKSRTMTKDSSANGGSVTNGSLDSLHIVGTSTHSHR